MNKSSLSLSLLAILALNIICTITVSTKAMDVKVISNKESIEKLSNKVKCYVPSDSNDPLGIAIAALGLGFYSFLLYKYFYKSKGIVRDSEIEKFYDSVA